MRQSGESGLEVVMALAHALSSIALQVWAGATTVFATETATIMHNATYETIFSPSLNVAGNDRNRYKNSIIIYG